MGAGINTRKVKSEERLQGKVVKVACWQLSGGSLASPILARIVAAGETYLIRDEQESCRASVLLVQVVPECTEESIFAARGQL
jgi:hypothetical protein